MDGTVIKRRKLRKGTSSCWECKRRKVRCIFNLPSDTACISCRRRGSSCVSQEFFEEPLPSPSDSRASRSEDRLTNLESIVQDLVRSVSSSSHLMFSSDAITNKGHTSLQLGLFGEKSLPPRLHGLGPPAPNKYIQLSRTLFEALPSQGEIESIWTAGTCTSIHLIQHFRMTPEENERVDYDDLKTKLLTRPSSATHPVLIARYMLTLAKFIQYLQPDRFGSLDGLSLPPGALMRRLAETASSLTIENEELLATAEGLECVIIEGTIQANLGNIQRSWLSFRRALSIAQLMGIHRGANHSPLNYVDSPSLMTNYHFVWFRIVYVDRFLSLMLGLPQGSLDDGIASPSTLAQETPLGLLSRVHCTAASQILERNEGSLHGLDYEATRDIDQRLKRVANIVPCMWWLTPDFAATEEQLVFSETLRVVEQIYHFNLLNQLYLPFMLHLEYDSQDSATSGQHIHAKYTCVSSSREVLHRLDALRKSSRTALCCKSVDFLGLMAAITLLLSHIDSHIQIDIQNCAGNIMLHQRLTDRALIGRMLEYVEHIKHWNTDTLSHKSTEWVRELLAVEADAAAGNPYRIESLSPDEKTMTNGNGTQMVLISIAYFGLVRVTSCKTHVFHKSHLHEQSTNVEGTAAAINPTIAVSQIGLRPSPDRIEGDGIRQEMQSRVQTASLGQHSAQTVGPNCMLFEFSSDEAELGGWTLDSNERYFSEKFFDCSSLDLMEDGTDSQ